MMTDQLAHDYGGKTRTVEKWFCDICKIAAFEDFDDACRHEEECRNNKKTTEIETLVASNAAANTKAVKSAHPFFSGAAKPKTNDNSKLRLGGQGQNMGQENTSNSSIIIDSRKEITQAEPEDETQPENLKPKSARLAEKAVISIEEGDGARKRKYDPSHQQENDSLKLDYFRSKQPALQLNKPATKKTKTTKSAPPLASIFQKKDSQAIDEKKLLAEQRAAEFQIRQRSVRERERERQRKREEARQAMRNKSTTHDKPTNTHGNAGGASFLNSCPRFPLPNHVASEMQVCLPTKSYAWQSDSSLDRARFILRKTLPYQERSKFCFSSDGPSAWRFRDSDDTLHGVSSDSFSDVQAELSKLLGPLIEPKSSGANEQRLWVDKYSLALAGICGSKMEQMFEQLVAFVKDWMSERHKANIRMAERQRALQTQKKVKKKRKKKVVDDDDIWYGSDDEEDQLTSVCLVTGEIGSGKSSLVHAVAQLCGCKVLEINTSDKRGGQHLKRALEEATQSHSSMDMLQKREANFFRSRELEDSDDEANDLSEQLPTVTVVLIDEVENIYESEGDGGFFSALSSLTKRARCPVFLTANAFPKWLNSTTISFKHVHTSRPSPDECANQMMAILEQEDICARHADGGGLSGRLAHIAELCNCDLRRLIHELQLSALYLGCSESRMDSTNELPPSDARILPRVQTKSKTPVLSTVTPDVASHHNFTLLTIKGRNFSVLLSGTTSVVSAASKGYPVNVFVGKHLCPAARILDDCTMLAVCPPLVQEAGQDSNTVQKCNRMKSARFAPLVVKSYFPCGVYSSTWATPTCPSARMQRELLNVQYTFGGNGFDYRSSGDCTMEMAEELFRCGLDSYDTSDGASKLESMKYGVDKYGENVMSVLAQDFALRSDAALLGDELVSSGIPFLSGSTRGFGFSLTGAQADGNFLGSLGTGLNRHGTQCSEERLMTCGWKDNACFYGDSNSYMTLPATARERGLLTRSEALGRGLAFPPACTVSEPSANEIQEDRTDENFDLTLWSPDSDAECISEEDAFLPFRIPTALLSLPGLLLNSREKFSGKFEYSLLRDQRVASAKGLREMLDSVQPQHPRMIVWRGQEEIIGLDLEPYLFLDYIPLLRVIAAQEKAADNAFQEALKIDPESVAAFSYGNRRSSRRSTQPKRQHYFETLLHGSSWHNEVAVAAQDMGTQFAEALLVYEREEKV